MKKLIVCADDYGLSPAISFAIRQLISKGRLNATSVMVTAPELVDLNSEDIILLKAQKQFYPELQIGLHLTLTKCLPALTHNRGFMPLSMTYLNCFIRSYEDEIIAQYHKFFALFGFYPDYVDGHQHVHVLPRIRPVVYKLIKTHAPNSWVRQCVGAGFGSKAKLISFLSRRLKSETQYLNIKTNAAFSGSYHFDVFDFRPLFLGFLKDLPDNSLIMVHPGRIDAKLRERDPVWNSRVIELEYLQSEQYLTDLKQAGYSL